MSSAIKVCRVCGKEYESCRSANRKAGVFRWQEVACSPECGAIYLDRINESRNIATALQKNKHKKGAPQPMAEAICKVATDESVAEIVGSTGEMPVKSE